MLEKKTTFPERESRWLPLPDDARRGYCNYNDVLVNVQNTGVSLECERLARAVDDNVGNRDVVEAQSIRR